MVHGETFYQSQMAALIECRCPPRGGGLFVTAPFSTCYVLLLAWSDGCLLVLCRAETSNHLMAIAKETAACSLTGSGYHWWSQRRWINLLSDLWWSRRTGSKCGVWVLLAPVMDFLSAGSPLYDVPSPTCLSKIRSSSWVALVAF